MARPNKMWFRKSRNAYFVTIRGETYKLGKDEEAAQKEFHRLLSLDEPPPPPSSEPLAVEVLDRFLVWTQANKAVGTYDWYHRHIQSFIDALPNQTMEASKVKPFHVTDWVKPTWSASYTRGAMIAVQRAFRWAVKQGHIDKSPLDNLEKPSAERRDNCPTQADFDLLIANTKDDFKDVLTFVWETGLRPHELVIIELRHVKGDRIEFMVKESKGKARKRVIYLTDKAKALVNNRIKPDKTGENPSRVFTNRNGKPWTRFAIDCRMKRLAVKTGRKFALVDLRHGFATRMLEAGMDHVTLAALMGHTSPAMICKVYAHVGQNTDRLASQMKKYSA